MNELINMVNGTQCTTQAINYSNNVKCFPLGLMKEYNSNSVCPFLFSLSGQIDISLYKKHFDLFHALVLFVH